MALIDTYKDRIKYIHNHSVDISDTITDSYNYGFTVNAFDRSFIFDKTSKEVGVQLSGKELVGGLQLNIDKRSKKDLTETINPFDSIEDTTKVNYRGLFGIGYYDGIPFSLNQNIVFFKNTDVDNVANFDTFFDTSIDQYGIATYLYRNKLSPMDVPNNSNFYKPAFPSYNVLSTNIAGKFGSFDTDAKLGSEGLLKNVITSGDLLDTVLFDSTLEIPYIDFSAKATAYASFDCTIGNGNNGSYFVSIPIKFRDTDAVSQETILLSADANNIINIEIDKTDTDEFAIVVNLYFEDTTTQTLTSRSVKCNLESFQIISLLVDNDSKRIYFFLNDQLLDSQFHNQAKTNSALPTSLTCHYGGTADTNCGYIMGDFLLYDLGDLEIDGLTLNTDYWINHNIPLKVISTQMAKFEVIP